MPSKERSKRQYFKERRLSLSSESSVSEYLDDSVSEKNVENVPSSSADLGRLIILKIMLTSLYGYYFVNNKFIILGCSNVVRKTSRKQRALSLDEINSFVTPVRISVKVQIYFCNVIFYFNFRTHIGGSIH